MEDGCADDVSLLDCIYCPAQTTQGEHFTLRGRVRFVSLRQLSAFHCASSILRTLAHLTKVSLKKCITTIPPLRSTGVSHKDMYLMIKMKGGVSSLGSNENRSM